VQQSYHSRQSEESSPPPHYFSSSVRRLGKENDGLQTRIRFFARISRHNQGLCHNFLPESGVLPYFYQNQVFAKNCYQSQVFARIMYLPESEVLPDSGFLPESGF
jgi:hypothetical protein